MKEIENWMNSVDWKEEEKNRTIFKRSVEKEVNIPCVFSHEKLSMLETIYLFEYFLKNINNKNYWIYSSLEIIKFIEVQIDRIYILWMFILRKIKETKFQNKIVVKRYSNIVNDKEKIVSSAKGHKHLFIDAFESKLIDKGPIMEISRVEEKGSKFCLMNGVKNESYNNLSNEIMKVENFKTINDIYAFKKESKFFKSFVDCFDYVKELKLNKDLVLMGIENIPLKKTQAIIIGNCTTSAKNAIPVVKKDILEGYLAKGINLYDSKYLVVTARNVKELLNIILLLKQMEDDYKQKYLIKKNTDIPEVEKYMSNHCKNVLNEAGFEEVKIAEIKSIKMIENHFRGIIEKEKEKW